MLIDKLIGRCEEVDWRTATPPARELEKTDKVIGLLPDELKRLFLVKRAVSERVIAAAKKGDQFNKRVEALGEEERDINMAGLREEAKKLKREMVSATIEYHLLAECFWASVRFQFPDLLEEPHLAVCNTWQVVIEDPLEIIKREACDALEAMFRDISQ